MTEPLSSSEKPQPKKMSEIDAAHTSWGMALPTTGGCLFCPDFRPTGTAMEVKLECEDHRAREHPELQVKKRRRRPHANPAVMSFRQSLTEDEEREIDKNRARRMRLLGIES